MRLLVTRPEPDAERTAAVLQARGHSVVIAPLLRVEPLAGAAIGSGPWAAVLVTSANIAQAIAEHAVRAALIHLPVFAVGERSARAMRTLGCPNVISAGGNAGDLARIVAAHLNPPARLLYLAGEQRSGDLGGELRAKGFAVETVAIYRAVTADTLPPEAAAALAGGIDGVLHFSRRSAEAYLEAARAAGLLESALRPAHFCLSAQVAAPLQGAGCRLVRVARQSAETALLDLIGTVQVKGRCSDRH
jgi:uroporphyrinogen-III synthase